MAGKKSTEENNKYFQVSLDTFLYNAGIVGFIQILEEAGAKKGENKEEVMNNKKDYYYEGQDLFVSKKYIKENDLSQIYIDGMINKFGEKTSISETFKNIEYLINKKDIEESEFDNKIDSIITSLSSASIKTGCETLQSKGLKIKIQENIDNIKKNKKDADKMKKYLKEIQNDYSNKEVKQTLLMKNIMYSKIRLFWENKSFLLPANSKKDLKEEFNKSFEEPLKSIVEKTEGKYNCITCEMETSNKMDTTFLFEVGVDTGRKKSAFWNCSPDSFICPLCNFIYACSPIGFIEMGNNNLVFVNYNDSIEYLIKMNTAEQFKEDTKHRNEKYLFYNKIIEKVLSIKTKELNSFQVITRNDKHYSANIIGKDALQIIKERESDLKFISSFIVKNSNDEYINMFEECLYNILNFRNQWLLIFKVLKNDDKNNSVIYSALYSILKIQISQKNINKEGGIMEKKINLSYFAGKSGDEMRRIIIGDRSDKVLSKEENEEADNKLRGLVYQLINAVYTNNRDIFFSNITRLYTGMNISIPTIFTNIFEDDEYFKEIGFAYILGLKGAYNKKENKEEGENNGKNEK